jgi:hypothetical protein
MSSYKFGKLHIEKQNQLQTIKKNLYVPYRYKNEVKSKGALWDPKYKRWYVYSSNPNFKYLVNTYHSYNFYDDTKGCQRLRDTLLTIEESEKEIKQMIEEDNAKQEEFLRLKNKWIEANGNDDGFAQSYSVNILNHE